MPADAQPKCCGHQDGLPHPNEDAAHTFVDHARSSVPNAPMRLLTPSISTRQWAAQGLAGLLLVAGTVLLHDAGAAEPPRAARPVHLWYPAPDAMAFYNEMAVDQTTTGSYFMACGWNTGYFGIQQLGDGRKIVLFSVWDPTTGDDPGAVKPGDRVECLHSAPDARIKRFGGEGTGGQCMSDFDWTTGETIRFVVTAAPADDRTAYAGYVWQNKPQRWKHLVTFRTRTGGQPLRGLYSFIEDFRRDTRSAQEVRSARFGSGWVKTPGGDWQPLNEARFTASQAEWEARDTIDAGLENGCFRLTTGGDTTNTRQLNSTLKRPPRTSPPPNLENELPGR